MEWLLNVNIWVGLLTLTALEIVLGVDNIVFIAILAGKLPHHQQARARRVGLVLAMAMRILLLLSITWVIGLTKPIMTISNHEISGRDLILLVGGIFLLAKSTLEIHAKLEGEEGRSGGRVKASFVGVIIQIMILDLVFSLDSVITAVGMVDQIAVMIAAVVIAVGIMLVSAGALNDFIHKHPTVKMLALAFLLLIGMSLVAEGLGQHISKGYIYFAMGFSIFVEMLNLRARRKQIKPVELREAYVPEIGDKPAA
jgi:predicted tellurium resistance membrane protein TerC